MKKLLPILFFITMFAQFAFGQSENLEKSEISARWLCGNFGAYNMPLPLKIEIPEELQKATKININAGAFDFSFQNISKETTLWIEYPRGTDKISCILVNDDDEEIAKTEIPVPIREIRSTNQRFTAIIADDENLFHNTRFANFLINQQEMPTNWHQLATFDEIVIVDFRALTENQISAIKEYVKAGGMLIILERFADTRNLLNRLTFNDISFTQDNSIESLNGRNHILLRSLSQYCSGMIFKYRISDNLGFSDELEIVRKDLNKINLPWSLEYIKNIADFADIDETQFFVSKAVERRNKLMLYITLAMFVTLMILIIGLKFFKNLSNAERMAAICLFCIVLAVVIMFMQGFNSVDFSSININFSANSVSGAYNLKTELKMLKFNHAGTFAFPKKSDFVRIVSADSDKFSKDIKISFSDQNFTVKIVKQTTLYIATISTNSDEKNIAILNNTDQTVASNLSDEMLRKLVHIKDFSGSMPVDLKNFSNKVLEPPKIPYRKVFNNNFNTKNSDQRMFVRICLNLVLKDREFAVCFATGFSENFQIFVSPIINQK